MALVRNWVFRLVQAVARRLVPLWLIAYILLPQMSAFEGKSWNEVEAHFKKVVEEVNATLPTTHRVTKITVRQEDFKRTGSLKVARNQ